MSGEAGSIPVRLTDFFLIADPTAAPPSQRLHGPRSQSARTFTGNGTQCRIRSQSATIHREAPPRAHPQRSCGRHVRGQHCNSRKPYDRGAVGVRVERSDAKEHAFQVACQRDGADESDNEAAWSMWWIWDRRPAWPVQIDTISASRDTAHRAHAP